jgi:type IV pilus assembly protein PilB
MRKSLGDILVEKGVLTEEKLKQAKEVQKTAPSDLGLIIEDLGFADERSVAEARAASMNIQFVDLSKMKFQPEAVKSVPEHMIRRFNILPFRRQENKLMVAFGDIQSSPQILEDIKLVSRCTITPVLATKSDVEEAINRALGGNGAVANGGLGNGINTTIMPGNKTIMPGNKTIMPGNKTIMPGSPGLGGAPGIGSSNDLPALIRPDEEKSATPVPIDSGPNELAQAINLDITEMGGDLLVDEGESEMKEMSEEAPIIRIAYAIVQQAIRDKASDIHIEPGQKGVRIRYRIDGVLDEKMTVPKHIQNQLTARFKIMADMNIAERRVPQDGRIPIKTDGKDYDLRVNCLPTNYGEKIVMRILDKTSVLLGLNKLGFSPQVQAQLEELVSQPNGMVLTTGPTGSGKTTTLYSILHKINTVEKNIITIEDPIEYQLPGVTQVGVNRKAGLTFAMGLRAFLRQDPDVIMVGEMRDVETATIAVESSLTGHLVLSTLHTNDSPSAVMRLADMGIENYLIAATVIGIMAQRLCRKICSNCKEPYRAPATELVRYGFEPTEENQMLTLYRGAGCEECGHRGYKGRIGLYELLVMNEEIRDLVVRRAPVGDIRDAAKTSGMKELREDGLWKVLEGMTTPDEVRRVVFTAGN